MYGTNFPERPKLFAVQETLSNDTKFITELQFYMIVVFKFFKIILEYKNIVRNISTRKNEVINLLCPLSRVQSDTPRNTKN